jgi:hypothetical protein
MSRKSLSMESAEDASIETYPLLTALAAAVSVDRECSMFKKKQNTAMVLAKLRKGNFVATDDDMELAKQIYAHFDEIIVMAKLGDTLVTHDMSGRYNDFNCELSRIYASNVVNCRKDMPMIASLPYARRIATQREFMANFRSTNARNGFIGELNERMHVDGQVIDVRPTRNCGKQRHYIITVVTPELKIGKFFMFPKQDDCTVVEQQSITLIGTPSKHGINEHTDCEETMFRRAKII